MEAETRRLRRCPSARSSRFSRSWSGTPSIPTWCALTQRSTVSDAAQSGPPTTGNRSRASAAPQTPVAGSAAPDRTDRSPRTTGRTRQAAAARRPRGPANPLTPAPPEPRPAACRADRPRAASTSRCSPGRWRRARVHTRPRAGAEEREAARCGSMASSLPSCPNRRTTRSTTANAPAIRDRRQPLEREVRVRLTRQECLERAGRSELERRRDPEELPCRIRAHAARMPRARIASIPTGGGCRPCAASLRADAEVPRQSSLSRPAPTPRRRWSPQGAPTFRRAAGDDFRLSPKLSDYNALIPHWVDTARRGSALRFDAANYHQSLSPR